jgi:hypothetical protein
MFRPEVGPRLPGLMGGQGGALEGSLCFVHFQASAEMAITATALRLFGGIPLQVMSQSHL